MFNRRSVTIAPTGNTGLEEVEEADEEAEGAYDDEDDIDDGHHHDDDDNHIHGLAKPERVAVEEEEDVPVRDGGVGAEQRKQRELLSTPEFEWKSASVMSPPVAVALAASGAAVAAEDSTITAPVPVSSRRLRNGPATEQVSPQPPPPQQQLLSLIHI